MMIPDYLERLARELDFDRSLSRSVRQEVEDHLWETVAADPDRNTCRAQQRAIAHFGDARTIAAEFAAISLARHSRRTAIAVILVIASVFIVMKVRIATYAGVPLAISDHMQTVSALVVAVDRYAFWSSFVIGLGGWAHLQSHRLSAAFDSARLGRSRRFVQLCRGAIAALIVSVGGDTVLTALRLHATEFSTVSVLSIVSIAIEIICVGILVHQVRRVALRAASVADLTRS